MRLFAAFLLISCSAFAKPSINYSGPTTQEGRLSFSAHVDMHSNGTPTQDQAREVVRHQLLYLIGNLQSAAEGTHATPSMAYTLDNIHVAQGAQSYRVSYDFKSNVAVELGTAAGEIKVDLPNDPEAMEKLPIETCNDTRAEPIWYGFNPNSSNCTLVRGQDFDQYTARLALTPNTTMTYPEYERLAKGGALRVDVLLNSEIERPGPYISHLRQQGFKETKWTPSKITAWLKFTPSDMPLVEEFTKGGMTVRLFSGIARVENLEPSKAFHSFYKDALENANVVVYNGHSGLGSNIDLALIEKNENFTIKLKDDYQIYYLGGCITYSYYVDKYLARKATTQDPRGTKNLDILGFGQESPGFDAKPLIALSDALAAYMENGTKTSYQDITDQIRYSWFAVIGDEDNQ